MRRAHHGTSSSRCISRLSASPVLKNLRILCRARRVAALSIPSAAPAACQPTPSNLAAIKRSTSAGGRPTKAGRTTCSMRCSMPPPQAIGRTLVCEACRLEPDVGGATTQALAAASGAHEVGAHMMEDADEVRRRICLRLPTFGSNASCEPPDPGLLHRVIDQVLRHASRHGVRGQLQRSYRRTRRGLVAGRARRRGCAVAGGRACTLRVGLFVHRSPRVKSGARTRRSMHRI